MGVPDAARKSNQPARWVAVLAMPDCRRCCTRRSSLQRWHHVGLCKHSERLYAPAMVVDVLPRAARTTDHAAQRWLFTIFCQHVGNFAVRASLYEASR
jgi:hypothetical protein